MKEYFPELDSISKIDLYVSFGLGMGFRKDSFGRIRVAHIRVSCYTAVWEDSGAERLEPYYDAYEDIKDYINSEFPEYAVAFQTSPEWPRMMVELAFVDGVKWSILFTCIMCGATMILFTRNVAISAFVTGKKYTALDETL